MMSFVGSVKNIEMHGDKIHISEQDAKAERKRGSYGVPLGGGDHIPGLNVKIIEQSYECINQWDF